MPEEEIWRSADAVPQVDEQLLDSWTGTFGDARFRAVLAQLIGSSTSSPALLATYREQYIEPRRQVVRTALERARRDGRLAEDPDVDIDAVIDMVVGAAMYRMLVAPAVDDPTDSRRYLDNIISHANRLLG